MFYISKVQANLPLLPRPQQHLSCGMTLATCVLIIVFAVAANFTRLLEYKTEVDQINKPTHFSVKSNISKLRIVVQTVTAEYPAYMEVEGAIRLSSEDTGAGVGAGNVSTWQWKVVLPTPWRLDEGYIQVDNFR